MATSPNYAQNLRTGRNLGFAGTKSLATNPEVGTFLKIGFGLLLLDTFLSVSRFLEIAATNFGFPIPYVATTIHALAFGLACLTGGALRLATNRTGIFMILLTGWMMACAPFSSWRTGSALMILYNWMPSLMAFFAAGLLSSLRQCTKFGAVMALSGFTIAVASLVLATFKAQRFAFDSGTLGNANDLAMLLLLAAPFFLVPFFDPAGNPVAKYVAPLVGLFVLVVNFQTGSRAGLVALLVMLLALFLSRSLIGKLKLAAVVVALAALLLAFIPSYSLYRYTTIFDDANQSQDRYTSETLGSSELRKELLRESLMVTLQHPLFGVGPGVYAPAMAREAQRQGKLAHWAVSHNTYTQVSSEMGFPGLIFLLAAIVCAYLDIFWTLKHSRNDSATNALALCLLLSMVGLNVNLFFSSNAYMAWLPILLGLATALRINLQREVNARASVARSPANRRTPVPQLAPSTGMRTTSDPAVGTVGASVSAPAPTIYRFLGRLPRSPR